MITALFIHTLSALALFSGGASCPMRIEPLIAEPFDCEFVALGSDGSLQYRASGRDGSIPLEDVARLTPIRQLSPTTSAPTTPLRTIYLTDKGVLEGGLVPARGPGARRISMDVGLKVPIELDLNAVAALRFAKTTSTDAERELQSRLADPPQGKDLLMVLSPEDRKPVLIPGALDRVTPEEWEFSLGRKSRKSPLDAAYAVILGARPAADTAPPALVSFGARNRLAGRIRSADSAGLTLECAAGAVTLPWTVIEAAALRSDRVVLLSDIEPADKQSRSFLDVSWPMQKNKSVTGGPISLHGRSFESGIGVHAFSSLTYHLDRRYERFTAVIGIDDAVGTKGSVIFRVIADGKLARESKTLHGSDDPLPISVDLTGVETMTLECDPADNLDLADHADWARAVLYRTRARDVR